MLTAVKNISRSLTDDSFGMVLFDFTDLDRSEGEFAETDFSANIADLIAVSDYLMEH